MGTGSLRTPGPTLPCAPWQTCCANCTRQQPLQPATTSYRFRPRPPRAGEIISHGDLGPWNTVYRDGIPVAFIDWDSAGPVSPLDDLADAAWTFVPLAPPRQLIEADHPLPDLPARLRLFVEAYGLTDRKAILPALERSMTGAAGRHERR